MHQRAITKLKTPLVLCTALLGACIAEPNDDELDETEQAVCNNDCDDDPEGNPSAKPSPKPPRVTARTLSSLTVQYETEAAWTSLTLQKRPPGGSWATASSAGLGTSGPRTYTDGGKTADSRTCYRLRAANIRGTSYSPEACGLTTSPNNASNPALSRLQLRIKVANVSDAGTTALVTARLNRMSLPASHFNALNPAPRLVGGSWVDSFATNNTFTYELELKEARRLRDITEVSIFNWGSDALCVERMELLVNGGTAMVKDFGTSTCIENETGSSLQPELVVPFEELRAASSFTGFVSPAFDLLIDRDEIEARVEGLVGNIIWDKDAKWGKFSGNRAVETSRVNASTVHVDLDLEGEINNFPNIEIDLDFDLVVGLVANGTGFDLSIDVTNVTSSADFAWWTELIAGVLGGVPYAGLTLVEYYVEKGIEDSFSLDTIGFPLTGAACPFPLRPNVTVIEGPALQFGCGA